MERFAAEKLILKRGGRYDITNLGALLFAKDLRHFATVHTKAPRIVVFAGKSKLQTLSDGFSTKGYVVGFETLLDDITARLPAYQVIGRAWRDEVKLFPAIAIRELVANALVHQDFTQEGLLVTIEIYADRLEIGNPGLSPIAPDRLIDSYQARNETLAELLRRLRICERQGSGVDKAIAAVEAGQLPAPEFRNGAKHFTAILFAPSP